MHGFETESLNFSMSGEFVTKMARDWFFTEQRPYAFIEQFLLFCMSGTDTPEGKLRLMAQEVLLGRAEFRGDGKDGTITYVTLDTPATVNMFEEYEKLRETNKGLLAKCELSERRYARLVDFLVQWSEDEYSEALESIRGLKDGRAMAALLRILKGKQVAEGTEDSSIEAPVRERTEITDDDFGWLKPDGTFIQVDWGHHMEWSADEVDRNKWHLKMMKNRRKNESLCEAEDFLVEVKGYVLIHDPGYSGMPIVEIGQTRRLTKAQREYLFGYYYDRGFREEAKKYLGDD